MGLFNNKKNRLYGETVNENARKQLRQIMGDKPMPVVKNPVIKKQKKGK